LGEYSVEISFSHLSANLCLIPLGLANISNFLVSHKETRKIILSKYQVLEEIRRERQRYKTLENSKLQKKLKGVHGR